MLNEISSMINKYIQEEPRSILKKVMLSDFHKNKNDRPYIYVYKCPSMEDGERYVQVCVLYSSLLLPEEMSKDDIQKCNFPDGMDYTNFAFGQLFLEDKKYSEIFSTELYPTIQKLDFTVDELVDKLHEPILTLEHITQHLQHNVDLDAPFKINKTDLSMDSTLIHKIYTVLEPEIFKNYDLHLDMLSMFFYLEEIKIYNIFPDVEIYIITTKQNDILFIFSSSDYETSSDCDEPFLLWYNYDSMVEFDLSLQELVNLTNNKNTSSNNIKIVG